MFESSITVKGQTTLPKAVRESLAVKAGDRVRYVILDEGVLIMPVRSTSRLFGSLKPESTEGRPWGQPLKKPEGAPLNLG